MIIDQKGWDNTVKINADPYGKACVDVTRRVMEILDEAPGPFDCHDIICRADDNVKAGGITGFMAGCVASMIKQFHSRGDEFNKQWNKGYGVENSEGTVNPAIMTINKKLE